MHSKDEDFKLIKAVQFGDKAAFNRIVLKYQYKVLKLLQIYIKDRHECIDLVQDIFLKVYENITKFKHKSSFYTWLYKITTNTAKSYLVSKYHYDVPESNLLFLKEEYSLAYKPYNTDNNPIAVIAFNELENIFFMALNKLPFELKNTLILRELDGLTYEEIAEINSCPIGTVRSRISRARDAIEKQAKMLKY